MESGAGLPHPFDAVFAPLGPAVTHLVAILTQAGSYFPASSPHTSRRRASRPQVER